MTTDPALEALRSLLLDHVDRIDALVDSLTRDLPTPIGTYRPDTQSNTVCWLVWHQARVLDDHGADLAGTAQVWTDEGWYDELGLPFPKSATGYGQSGDDVARVVASGEKLAGYHRDVTARLRDYLRSVDVAELERVVDTRWDPPVTAAVRIVSMLDDSVQHLGQAAYVRGVAERAGLG
ncbi:mycothiol transferase [Mumia sp. DW29H23]|uniref:mycothiol transferase n=1 Tax=Mumia sp. DW29H23 TaxID=3421241 RepID=UPI003D68D4DD